MFLFFFWSSMYAIHFSFFCPQNISMTYVLPAHIKPYLASLLHVSPRFHCPVCNYWLKKSKIERCRWCLMFRITMVTECCPPPPLPHYGLLYLTMVSPSHVSPDPLCTQWVITASCFSCIYYFPVLLIFVSIFFTFCAVMGSPRHWMGDCYRCRCFKLFVHFLLSINGF